MAKGAAWHTASLMAQNYNLNRGKGDQALSPDDLNPYIHKAKSEPISDLAMVEKAWKALIGG